MYLRVSRLKFLLVRCCFISLILIFILQIATLLRNDHDISLTYSQKTRISERSSSEDLFWQSLAREDDSLSDEQRLQKLDLNEPTAKKELNWTAIFLDNYARKLEKLKERDARTKYKFHVNEKDPSNGNEEKKPQETIEVFEATPVFERPKFCSATRIFHPQCPFSNCVWKCKTPSNNPDQIRRASVFHHVDIKADEMRKKLKNRRHHDIWILWVDEANRQLQHLNKYQFNWTLSFRQDSEVSSGSYGLLLRQNDQIHHSNQSDASQQEFVSLPTEFIHILVNRSIPITDRTLENHILTSFRFRHKHALWFVSNCGPKYRLNYYEQLKFAFPINAFGSCIKKRSDDQCDKSGQCERNRARLALFYLAFESQTCTDYITEKFWRALFYGMIPVVLGPSKQSYLDLGVPETAFIHVDDFKSPQALGNYMHQIANDYFSYRKYFQWQKQFQVFYEMDDLEPIRMCELCMRLNIQDKQHHSFYTNLHEWHRAGC